MFLFSKCRQLHVAHRKRIIIAQADLPIRICDSSPGSKHEGESSVFLLGQVLMRPSSAYSNLTKSTATPGRRSVDPIVGYDRRLCPD